ncbi:hypothetical protein NL676_026766 [Syzygium grande]|nr:hypothetical protein NL676_026766 [Syzygium grande]
MQRSPAGSSSSPKQRLREEPIRDLILHKRQLVDVPYTASLAETMSALVINRVLAVPVAGAAGPLDRGRRVHDHGGRPGDRRHKEAWGEVPWAVRRSSAVVYHGHVARLWEGWASGRKRPWLRFPNSGVRIHRYRAISERCPLCRSSGRVSSFSVRCKLESSSPVEQVNLINLHASCFYEFKVSSGDNESERVFLYWCLGEDSRSVTVRE